MAKQKNSQQLRIIGGQWRGRKLNFPDIDGLRPTGDRVRETLFNWLAPYIHASRCLDLFAGSGALGLEALSRECAQACFVDTHKQAVTQLRTNIALLKAGNAIICHQSAKTFLQSTPSQAYDIVFIDPPFALNLWQETIDLLAHGQWLNQNSLIYIEHPTETLVHAPAHWSKLKDKQAGRVQYQLFQNSH